MEFWKTKEECRVIKRVEVLDKIECDVCGCIITKDAEDDTYIRATTRIFDDYGEQITARTNDWCRKCSVELVTRELLSHKNSNIKFSIDIKHVRQRYEKVVEENADTHEQIEGSML